jgi:seryl-tRNA synthetase
MIDINLLRSNLTDVVSRLENRGLPADFVERFLALEGTRKNLQARTEETQAKRNQRAKLIGQLKAKKTPENDPELAKMMAEAASLGIDVKRDEAALEILQQELSSSWRLSQIFLTKTFLKAIAQKATSSSAAGVRCASSISRLRTTLI